MSKLSLRRIICLVSIFCALGLVLGHAPSAAAALPDPSTSSAAQAAARAAYGKLPLSFEVNQGQTAKQVKFLSRGAGYVLFLTPSAAVLTLRIPDSASKHQPGRTAALRPISLTAAPKPAVAKYSVLRIGLEGATPNPQLSGLDELAGKSNYFIGHDPKKWRSNI